MILPSQQKIKSLEEIVKETIIQSLKCNTDNLSRVAKELKITRPRLKRYIKKFNISVEENTRRNWR